MKRLLAITILAYGCGAAAVSLAQDNVVREDVEGITNFAHIETTVACAGAITPESVAEIKRMGFSSIINLRRASEQGANIEAEAAAAETADIRFFHLPFGGNPLDPGVADQFLEVITAADTEPAFIHCAGGGRAAMMWMLKRVVVDAWDVDRALEEATALGLRPESQLRDFALEYIAARSG
ncbi:MAG: sulfur transferase domain-containing protein [Gammaproteobacteria bacterium]|jgi:uncharacterized protein (TIGR01244 family)